MHYFDSMKDRVFHRFILLSFGLALLSSSGVFSQPRPDSPNKPVADTLYHINFDDYFTSSTLRVDYFMAGYHDNTSVYLSQIRKEPYWGGNHKNLIDFMNLGSFRYIIMDSATGKIIYIRGFSNLFQEWQGTEEAKTLKRAFAQVAVVPFPLHTILFQIDIRSITTGKFEKLFETYINPRSIFINKEKNHQLPFVTLQETGDPENRVDLALVAEGYTAEEMPKFLKDAERIMDYFFTVKPYSDYKNKFNIYAIESPSDESGVTIPGRGVYLNTSGGSSFYTFNMDRYMTIQDSRAIYDIAANVPYDVIFVLVNSAKYGGGGFFNHYGESTVDNYLSEIVSIHEFGHTFAGLADEYYTSEVTYSDFYKLDVEPWEPNITTNVNFDQKWRRMIPKGTPVPTPRTEEYKGTIGMFEGGGYMGKGVYSPMMDCRMKSNEAKGFCPVCEEAIKKMILFDCE